jgi:cytochrome oxidase assembly protein ShyY1
MIVIVGLAVLVSIALHILALWQLRRAASAARSTPAASDRGEATDEA